MHKGPYHPRKVPIQGKWSIHHPLYSTWNKMFSRCENPNDSSYKNYGGRGISVCKRWYHFKHFAEDMGAQPPGTSIERIDNNGNYCKSNCCWATRSEQALNRRKFSNNTTGSKGVVKHGVSYQARMDYEHTRYVIGYFKTKREATMARQEFEALFVKDPVAAITSIQTDKARVTSSTGVRGITPHARGGFTVRITRDKERIYLGYFQTFDEACHARRCAIES